MRVPLRARGEAGGAGPARRAAVVILLFLVAGALAGVLWWLAWTPPQGVALQEQFTLTSAGLTEAFSGTALYAVVAGVTGLLLGATVALRADGHELATLGAVAVGALVAAPVMALVGTALGPPDADEAARGLPDYTIVQQDLRVEGVGAYLALPSGALLGVGGVFLSLSRRRPGTERPGGQPPDDHGADHPHRSGDDPAGSRDDEPRPR